MSRERRTLRRGGNRGTEKERNRRVDYEETPKGRGVGWGDGGRSGRMRNFV